MAVRFRLDGMRELTAQLQRLRPATAKAALQRGGMKAMQPMADLAARMAPFETGELESSIGVGTVARDDFASVGGREYSAVLSRGGSKEGP
jgi:hypothetical protein